MTNTNRGETPTDPRDASFDELEMWARFEADLTAYLSTMVDPAEEDHLLLELPGGRTDGIVGCAPYAQFVGFGDGRMIRAEVSGNAYLAPQFRLGEDGCEFFSDMGWSGNDAASGDVGEKNWYIERPVADVGEIANHVAWALQCHFGITHPGLLTHHACGPAAEGVGVLGLCATDEVPPDEPHAPRDPAAIRGRESVLQRLAIKPVDRDDLLHIVESLLREKYGTEPTVDDDGDFVLEHMGQPVWIRVHTEQPAVQIMARVAHDVRSRRATAVEIGLLNRDNLWSRWTLRDRSVWQTVVLPGYPVLPRHVASMLDLFLTAMKSTRDDLALRTGAKVA